MADPEATPASETDEGAEGAEAGPAEEKSGRKGRAIRAAVGAAEAAWIHRQELVAALELLREKKAVSEEEEQQIVSAYEEGNETTRQTIADLVERLEKANFGRVVIGIKEEAKQRFSKAVGPALGLQRGEMVRKEDLRTAGRGVLDDVQGEVRQRGEVIVQDLVRKGREALVQEETKELERVFIQWATETLTTAERFVSRILVGLGAVLLIVALLWSAHQVEFLQDIVRFLIVFLLVFAGILFITWGSKVTEWSRQSRQDLDEFLQTTPSRRLHELLEGRETPPAEPAPPEASSPAPPSDK